MSGLPRPLGAVLWDMDGLLVDSEPLWTVAQVELAARLGGAWTPELKARVMGTRVDVAVPLMLAGLGAPSGPADVAAAQADLLERMRELYATAAPLLPGAAALLAALRADGVPVALVSSSYRVLVDAVLEQTGLRFDVVVAGDEVQRGKPDPEPYLRAAALLGVEPRSGVVLEDSAAGVASGLAGGFAVVGVTSAPGALPTGRSRLRVLASLEQCTPALLRALVGVDPSAGWPDHCHPE